MRTADVLRAWRTILTGRAPSLSIEVTRECPLRCPGCYAYEDNHLGGETTLRQLRDFKGDDLINGVLNVVEERKPLHLSIVGGDPLVRYRELEVLVPQLLERGIHVQVVTSAFRPIPAQWATLDHVTVVVSIDGLQPEHDVRRKPATYDRIIKNVAGQNITVHCTITSQMLTREGYLEEFTAFWNRSDDVRKIWFSIFTPQRGDSPVECLTPSQREQVVRELLVLRKKYGKIDMPEGMINHFLRPPASPAECIFAMTTETISADLRTQITPCQFGGDPDCSQCGCIASMGLAAIGSHKLGGIVPVGAIFHASAKIGKRIAARRDEGPPPDAGAPREKLVTLAPVAAREERVPVSSVDA